MNRLHPAIFLSTILLFTACTYKNNSNQVNKELQDMQNNLDKTKRENDAYIDSLSAGGQPGQVRLNGVIVKDNALADDRISVTYKTGIGKNNTPATLKNNYSIVAKENNKDINVNFSDKDKSLMSYGCDEASVQQYADLNGFEVKKLVSLSTGVFYIYANTLILCGSIDQLNSQQFLITTDNLILDNVSLNKTDSMGFLTIQTNKLYLKGNSTITLKVNDEKYTISQPSDFELNVLKEVSSDSNSHLSIFALGGNYSAESK